jgi:hypothetical protein
LRRPWRERLERLERRGASASASASTSATADDDDDEDEDSLVLPLLLLLLLQGSTRGELLLLLLLLLLHGAIRALASRPRSPGATERMDCCCYCCCLGGDLSYSHQLPGSLDRALLEKGLSSIVPDSAPFSTAERWPSSALRGFERLERLVWGSEG